MTDEKMTDGGVGKAQGGARVGTAQADAPILEFDPARAVIEPSDWVGRIDVPEACVLCFFPTVLEELEKSGRARVLCHQVSIMGKHPLYELEVGGSPVAAFMPGLGAPLAAGLVDEVIARGCRRFVGCGSAGVVRKDITRNHLVVPTSAIRDEGTSYHYAAPSREIAPTDAALQALERVLKQQNVAYLTG